MVSLSTKDEIPTESDSMTIRLLMKTDFSMPNPMLINSGFVIKIDDTNENDKVTVVLYAAYNDSPSTE